MSIYEDLVDGFFERYDYPAIEPLIIGLSGIDPPLKCSGGEGGIRDHERLDNLLGGDDINGHYHVTREELEWLHKFMYRDSLSPN